MGSAISKVLAMVFGVILLGAVLGLDYYSFARKAEGNAGAGAYLAVLKARIAPLLDRAPPVLLAGRLPAAPDGWERHPLVQADAEAIIGRPYDAAKPAPDLTDDIVKRLLLSRRDDTRIAESYVRGDTVVALRVEVTPPGKTFSSSAKLARRAEAKLRDSLIAGGIYTDASGLVFFPLAQVTIDPATKVRTPVAYRRFWAGVPNRLEVEVVTNAADEEVLPILQGLESAALLAMTADAAAPATPVGAGAAPALAVAAAPASEAGSGLCIRRAGKLVCN